MSEQYLPYWVIVCVLRSMAWASSICYLCNWMQLPCICPSNALIVVFPCSSWSFRKDESLTYCLSYLPTYWCRWASSASKAAVGGYWKVKSSSSILTVVGSVVMRCSKEVSDWERGIIAGS